MRIKIYKSLNKRIFFISIILLINSFFIYSQTNNPPSISAEGNQVFCPSGSINIVTNFTITDPDDTGIEFFYIQISSGYDINSDNLILDGNHPTISSSWNQNEGKLTLESSTIGGEILFADLENAVKNIIFSSSNANITNGRTFSLTVKDKNYLPSTDHFYEFVDAQSITWSDAKTEAETRTFYGRQGYLATLTNQEEADFAGKQASGAGWIGGSDEETEGIWKWVTGPEAGTIFWEGAVNGSSPNFAFWNENEPNNSGDEDYAHITDPSIGIQGAWNDLPDEGGTGLYVPRGYIVEYGSPSDPPLNISASTNIYIPEITSTQGTTICESGLATISATSTEGDIFWYESSDINDQQEIGIGNDFTVNVTQTTIYYAAVSINGCETFSRTPVTITVNERPSITNFTNDLICSGKANLSAEASDGDIYWFDSLTSTTPLYIGNNFETPDLVATTRYYVEANVSNCISSSRTEVVAEVDSSIPDFDVAMSNYILCEDIGSIDLETINAQGNYTYEWKKDGDRISGNSSSINVNSDGIYTVSATSQAGCSSPEETIIVTKSQKSDLTKDDIRILDDLNNNSIEVINFNIGIGDYEFAIDDILGPYNNNGMFENLTPGVHTLYIRDRGGCGIQEYLFSILEYPDFFTPNGDNQNEIWNVNGYNKSYFTDSNLFIYNRYGNLIYEMTENSEGWDGTYGGKKLPENTYWFRAVLTDINGYSIEKFGNISLIR